MKIQTGILAACLGGVLCASVAWAQGRPYTGPEDPAGDISAIRSGTMNMNRLLLYFENNTQIADYPATGTSRWPNDYTGQRMIDVASILVGSEVVVYQDSIPIDRLDDPRLLETGSLDTLYMVESHSYPDDKPDLNYDGTVEWGIYPVPGYANPSQDYAAMSNKPESWPPEGWPLTGFTKVWPGEWNGRFGRGVMKAALESYFVANDAQDMEHIIQRNDPEQKLITLGPRYLPRPGRVIGDIDPYVTIQKGLPWGGLGLRYEVRGYQWANNEAQDIVFWEYNVSNISDYDLPKSGFGYYVDNSIGGDASGENEVGFRDKILDLAYVWERLGQGEGGRIPGVMGYAYLESPGKAFDGEDNDDDGVIDESRDNPAGQWVAAEMGPGGRLIDVDKFRAFNHQEPQPHWEGDEDQDWQDGMDPDHDGSYADRTESGEWVLELGAFCGDDVGVDGVGPGDLNYHGPDADGSECNHKPDFIDVKGEPNFGPLDVSESDMIGLTSFLLFDWAQWQNTLRLTLNEDMNVWNVMNSDSLSNYLVAGSVGSIYMIFASSPFPLYKGRTERVSMAFMAAYENLATLNAKAHRAENLFRLKEVAQIIYDHDYQFAQPPLMPTLKAAAGDGKVVLTWDDISDTKTREPLLQNANDFEGYKLYKSTDKFMSDARVITDGKGTKKYRAPLFQCDKVDTIKGYSNLGGTMDGHLVYLGDDTGIRHYFIDTDVQNGRTYYYALVAYDYGVEDLDIAPAESGVDIELDEAENVIRIGQNVQVVKPGQQAAGYVPPEIAIDEANTSERLLGGSIVPAVVDSKEILPGHSYRIRFSTSKIGNYALSKTRRATRDGKIVTSGMRIEDITESPVTVYQEDSAKGFAESNLQYDPDLKIWRLQAGSAITTDVFEGIHCRISVPADSVFIDRDPGKTGWIQGTAPIRVQAGPALPFFPFQYEIVFDPDMEYQSITNRTSGIYDVDGSLVSNRKRGIGLRYPFTVVNTAVPPDSAGNLEKLDLVLFDANENQVFDWDSDRILVGYAAKDKDNYWWGGTIFSIDFQYAGVNENPTAPGDRYRVSVNTPLTENDSFVFSVRPEVELNTARLASAMDSIKVVPNPYISTNLMETAVANKYLNQRRQIMFTHVPADCVIRVYTPSGVLVDRIDVDNGPEDGTVHWNLVSREGLEIAAGMYIYHVHSNATGRDKVGKFAVIK
ncbi:MAG: hypothetical protein QUS35_12780 [bacterium]|nr:hypothetical protein [bacterium]